MLNFNGPVHLKKHACSFKIAEILIINSMFHCRSINNSMRKMIVLKESYQSGKRIHLNRSNQGLHSCRVEEDQLPVSLPTQRNSRRIPHCLHLCIWVYIYICIYKTPINIIDCQSINIYICRRWKKTKCKTYPVSSVKGNSPG